MLFSVFNAGGLILAITRLPLMPVLEEVEDILCHVWDFYLKDWRAFMSYVTHERDLI